MFVFAVQLTMKLIIDQWVSISLIEIDLVFVLKNHFLAVCLSEYIKVSKNKFVYFSFAFLFLISEELREFLYFVEYFILMV